MTRIHPEPGEVDAAQAYAFPEGRTWLRANMIASADGAATHGGKSGGLGNATDVALFSLLRGLADVILVGASTVRVEGYGPVEPGDDWETLRAGRPAVPRLAVVSRRLDLDFSAPLFTESTDTIYVVTCEAASGERLADARGAAEVIVAGGDSVDFRLAAERLAALGHPRISCEGGPRLLAQVAADGALDELCLTVSPLLVAGDASRVLNGPPLPMPQPLTLHHACADTDYLFLRYLRALT